jgi:hypothetical protein
MAASTWARQAPAPVRELGTIATILSLQALIAAPLPGERHFEPRGLNQGIVNLKRLETILGSVGCSIEGAA